MGGHEEHEKHEEHEVNEGHEIYEGDEGLKGCKGQANASQRVPWVEGENLHWHDEGRPHEKQGWQDRHPQAACCGEEKLQAHQWLDQGLSDSPEGAWHQGLLCCWGKSAQGKALYAKAKSIYHAD